MMYWLIDKLVKNEKWTKLGKYMEPEIKYVNEHELPLYVGGICYYEFFGCKILIKSKYKSDTGISSHELAHARQYGRLWWLHSGLRMISAKYKLLIELECYREQIQKYNYNTKAQYEWIIKALHEKYNLKLEKDYIRKYVDYVFKDLIKV